MNDTVILFLALLAVFCQIFIVSTWALRLLSKTSPAARRAHDQLAQAIEPAWLWVAFVIAAVTMAGSLFLSEVAHFPPCKLCWYQRICLYPLVPLLLVAAIRRDAKAWPYLLTLAVIDIPISVFHYLVERFPSLEPSNVCDLRNPCTTVWVWKFHYLSTPLMAATSALMQITLMALARQSANHRPSTAA